MVFGVHMLKNFLSALWDLLPAHLRRWVMRATQTRFTVTAAGIVSNERGEVLLIKHRFRPGTGWGIPGGFLEAGEDADEGLRRELREEIGLELDTVRIYRARTFKRQVQIELVFLARAKGGSHPQSIEVERAEWFLPDSLPEGLPDEQRRLIESALRNGGKTGD
jgi:8-oxo-dGTP diphosphatase